MNIFQEKKNPSSYKDNNLHDNHLFYPKSPPTIALNNNISQVAACFENYFDKGSPPWAVILLMSQNFIPPQEDPNNRSQVQ
jgi:hypothetical protein